MRRRDPLAVDTHTALALTGNVPFAGSRVRLVSAFPFEYSKGPIGYYSAALPLKWSQFDLLRPAREGPNRIKRNHLRLPAVSRRECHPSSTQAHSRDILGCVDIRSFRTQRSEARNDRTSGKLRKKNSEGMPLCSQEEWIPAFAGKTGGVAALYPFPSRMLSTSGAILTAWLRSSPGVRLPSG